ncbi:hypothetical protein DSO57_1028213 [Entomophthora muscae]|uniref:Uncharacterized protein n=1 Tax=Entomophthora muscae TaxID=34485 RepID=A0ACC2T1M8_9FUNG|nr:hypothetical protein DSO57_1028213 [Entomophthora muscae]
MKTTSSLEVWHKHLKTKFGTNPKFNKFFQKLQEEQAWTVSKFCNLANQVAPKKRKSKDQDYQEDVQKVVKKKYKAAEIKKLLQPRFEPCLLTYLTIHRGRSMSCPLTYLTL